MLDQVKKGHSEESARRICGKLQGEAEGEMSEEKTPLRSVLLDVMPTADGAGLVEIPIAVTGAWKRDSRDFSLTPRDFEQMAANFKKRKNGEINIDYDHASEMPEMAHGGPIPSAGRVVGLRSNGMVYARVEFTRRALEMIQAKEYRFISPAIDYAARDKLTGEPQGTTLTSLALTNRPFLEELPPIRLSEITGADRNSKLEIRNSERENDQGGNMEALTATKLTEGKFQIVRGAEVLGSVDIAEPASPKPEEIVATFTEKIGAKGKTEEQLKEILRCAQDDRAKVLARETQDAAFKLLASECVKDGKLDREKMKLLARDQKATVEQFFTFEDAWGKVDAAVKVGKVLPKSREHALRIALSDAPAFDALMADAKAIVPLKATGLAGAGRQPSETGRPKNISAGKEVVNADRVARIRALQEQSAKAGKKLGYLEAHAIVLSEEQAAGIDGDGQAA